MSNNKEQETEENNENSVPVEGELEGLSAEQASEGSYDEALVWQKSKNLLLSVLGIIALGVGIYSYKSNSEREEQSNRSYRFLSANIDSDGAEKRFLSFADDYDDTLKGVALYRAAVIQYKDRRFTESAKNFELAAADLGNDPLAGRALIGQAVSLIKDNSMKGGEGKVVLEKLASSSAYLAADRSEALYLLSLQALTENDMEKMSSYKSQLAEDVNASYFLSRLEELIKTNKFLEVAKSLPDINLAKGQKFLADNGKKKGVSTLESGLQYIVLEKGTGDQPDLNDTVKVHYEGTLINGEIFDSSLERDEPASFPVNGVIKGWTEALQLMKEQAKWKLFVPANIAYGETGNGSIGPNETLIFEVELLEVTPVKVLDPVLGESSSDANSTSIEGAPVVMPELDTNKEVPILDGNASVPNDLNRSE
ncbi:FKBP-type peptidyl-prolyl cis-trans isomerase [Opitutales bacterium]|jgi:FKBP-type peptidyl-prolyl cis-trans isomerase FklB|nr:FKBP-type peptidyl-prolyl cis-trans isomerase [Opitutales bacterium]